MKKMLLFISIFILAFAFVAFAQNHGGMGQGMGQGNGAGAGMGMGSCDCSMMGGAGNAQATQVADAKAAEALVKAAIDKDYKGYKIVKTNKFEMPRGTMYQVEVVDAGGNKFEFHVSPWGKVMGPMLPAKK